MNEPVPRSFERGGCSHATGASFRSMWPAVPLVRLAWTLHDDGDRSPPALTTRITGRLWRVDGTPTSGGPNAASADGTNQTAAARIAAAVAIRTSEGYCGAEWTGRDELRLD
jgi:hypothetical protein